MASGRIKGLTIEINGNTTKLQKALESVDKSLSATKSSLRDVDKLLKLDPKNTELLAQKQRLLNDAIKDTAERQKTLEEAAKQAGEALEKGTGNQGQYDALQRELFETNQSLETLKGTSQEVEDAITNMAQESTEAVEEMADETKSTLDSLAEQAGNLGKLGSGMTKVGESVNKVSSKVTQFGNDSFDAAVEWETAFTGVRKTVDATEEEYEQLEKAILQMATETASSANDIAAVMEVAGQLGVSKENLVDFTRTMVELGDTTNLSAEEAATSLARFVNITGDSQADVEKLGSAIVDLGNNFATDEASIVQMSTRLAAAGKLAGLSSTDILALSTAMSSVGINAEAGGTAMAQSLKAISGYIDEFKDGESEALEKIAEISGMSAEAFAQTWENRPVEALTAFISGLGELDEKGESASAVLDQLGMSGIRQQNMLESLALASDTMTSAVETSTTAFSNNNALQIEAEKRYDTTAAKMSQTNEKINQVKISIGEALMPVVEKLMGVIEKLTNWWNSLSSSQQDVIIKIGMVVAVVGPLLIGLGKLITAVSTIMKILPTIKTAIMAVNAAMAANPVLVVVAAITALIAIFALLWENCEGFREFWIGLWEGLKSVCSEAWEAIKGFFQVAWDFITGLFSGIGEFFVGCWNSITSAFSAVGEFFSSIFSGAWEGITTAFSAVGEFFSSCWDAVTAPFEKAGEWFGNIFEGVKEAIKAPINFIIRAINKVIGALNSLSIDIPDWVPFVGGETWGIDIPKIPELARGGVLKRGQMALLEGAGAEAVIPLENNKAWIQATADAMSNALGGVNAGNGQIVIPVYIGKERIQTIVASANTRNTYISGGH